MERLLIASLATWRISSLIARENGPLWMFSNFRAFVGKKAFLGSKFFISLQEGIECTWCNSVWIAIIFALFVPGNYFMNIFAVSAGAIIIDSALGKLNG